MSQPQPQPRTRPGQQARPGDATGRKREQLAREQADVIKEREGQLSMITAERQRSMEEDVIDPITREVITEKTGAVRRMDEAEDDTPRVLGTGVNAVEELAEPKPDPSAPKLERDPNEKVIIRVNCDLEEVTLGYGNTVSFKEGGRYRVPRWMADHLDEKGLVWH
jgi:hypothetical protein